MPRSWAGVFLLLLLGYGIFIGMNFSDVAGGADSSGYFNSARLLAKGRLTADYRPIPEIGEIAAYCEPLGFAWSPRKDCYVPVYPVGLPLYLAASSFVGGWTWGPLVACTAAAVAAVFLCFLCGRELGISRFLAAAGAASLAVSPMFLSASSQPMSDALATTMCLAAIWAALRSRRSAGLGWGVACGAMLGMAVLVRPSNAILLPAILILIWKRRGILGAFLGGLPFALGLGAYQYYLYGNPMRSGYGDNSIFFGTKYFVPTIVHYGIWMPQLLPITGLALLLAFFLPWRSRRREIAALFVGFASFILFHSIYSYSHETWWYLRFILPAFPALVLLAMLGLEGWLRWIGGDARSWLIPVAAAAVVLLGLGSSLFLGGKLHPLATESVDRQYIDVCSWAKANLPADSLVICMQASGAVFYYTDFPILRWDFFKTRTNYETCAARLRASGRPLVAIMMEVEAERVMREIMADRWRQLAKIGSFTVWRLEP